MDMTVGQVAKRAGVSIATLHFYEQKGLIYSTRTTANQRRYSNQILRRIAVIKAAQNVGLTLQEISAALAHLPKNKTPKKEEWEKMSQGWHQMLDEKIKNLQNSTLPRPSLMLSTLPQPSLTLSTLPQPLLTLTPHCLNHHSDAPPH